MKRFITILLIFTATLFLVACGSSLEDGEEDEQEAVVNPEDLEMNEDEKKAEDEIVLTINDKDFNGEDYNALYAQTKSVLGHQGQDISNKEQLQDVVIEELIKRELLIEMGEEEGIEITEENIAEVKSENEKQYETVMEQYNLSEEEYDKQLAFELLLEKYIQAIYPAEEITDEEIQEVYDELKEATEDIPELELVEDEIREIIAIEKLSDKMEQRKNDADIETFI